MVSPPRKSLSLLVSSLVLLSVLVGLLAPSPVRADVGVQPILPGGSSIKPEEETPVQMAAEVVEMNVRAATVADNALVELNPRWYGYDVEPVWFSGVAEVVADFTMKNPTGDAVGMTVWFPLASALEKVNWGGELPGNMPPRIASFRVSVDGAPLDYTVSELPNPAGADEPALPWASFPVTFPAGKETAIQVSYVLPLQPVPKSPVVALYYVFQTGAGWAGPIGRAELIVNLPYPASSETLSGMASLHLPPSLARTRVALPSGATLAGKQARWTWRNFEPGRDDDFGILLLRPAKWQELEAARAAVQANPGDGRAWLELASSYGSLSLAWPYSTQPLFSSTYRPLCVQAYQKAAELLPEHPAPPAALGLLALQPYMATKTAPQQVMQYVQDELRTAKDLEARDPSLGQEGYVGSGDLEEALSLYFYNDATATADAATMAVFKATETARATIEHATRTARAIKQATDLVCWAASGALCTPAPSATRTLSPMPSLTSMPVPSTAPAPATPPASAEARDQGQNLVIMVAAGIIGLGVAGYLTLRLLRKAPGRQE